ncbi:galactosyltransferase-related protein [Paenibacillus solani]|uniref:Galactosyltransferase C-terminal domain-containing protein n=1 Tax=Paenibacillus solani TaxID=1705565 RepID=A0A0M1P550_9BACL|nr:galactosyltransferase-related protein [Paenibacillus solani]KOR89613.1 hypothetical protein AM231_11045 [Paenibacillus solani]
MFDQISVLIPYQSDGNGPRDAALEWVLGYYARSMPEAQICIGEISGSGERFSRSKAINLAYRQASKDILVIADSDIVYDPDLLRASAAHVTSGQWVIPFSRILRLAEHTSQLLLRQTSGWPLAVKPEILAEAATGFVGGFNMLDRNAYETVGGYDERFIGWGGEDEAFAYALDTLVSPHIRLDGEMVHFWHPFVGPDGNPHYESNYALYQRYQLARGDEKEMRRLIQESISQ